MSRRLLFALLILSAGIRAAPGDDALAPRRSVLRGQIEKAVLESARRLDRPPGPALDFSPRTDANTAYLWLALGRSPADARRWIGEIIDRQDMDPHSATYGYFSFRPGRYPIYGDDWLVTAFFFLPLLSIYHQFPQAVPPLLRAQWRPHLEAGLAAMRRSGKNAHWKKATNQTLLVLGAMTLMAEELRDQGALAEAKEAMRGTLEGIRDHGIFEFNSPAYSAVQLSVCIAGAAFCRDVWMKRAFGVLKDYLWADLAAHSMGGDYCGLGGAMSRSGDFLNGRGTADTDLYLGGFGASLKPDLADPHFGIPYAQSFLPSFAPPPEAREIAQTVPRLVSQPWGDRPGEDRTTRVERGFSLGSSGAGYSPDDRRIALRLRSGGLRPLVYFLADFLDDPYGRIRLQGNASDARYSKSRHLDAGSAVVQQNGVVLALMNIQTDLGKLHIDRKQAEEGAATVASNLVFPLDADEIVTGGQAVAPNFETLLLKSGQPVCLRYGKVAVCLKLFGAQGTMGAAPAWELKADGRGLDAGRLVVYHYRGKKEALARGGLRSGVVIIAEDLIRTASFADFCRRAAEMNLQTSLKNQIWKARLTWNRNSLEAALDVKKNRPVLRAINGQPIAKPALQNPFAGRIARLLASPSS